MMCLGNKLFMLSFWWSGKCVLERRWLGEVPAPRQSGPETRLLIRCASGNAPREPGISRRLGRWNRDGNQQGGKNRESQNNLHPGAQGQLHKWKSYWQGFFFLPNCLSKVHLLRLRPGGLFPGPVPRRFSVHSVDILWVPLHTTGRCGRGFHRRWPAAPHQEGPAQQHRKAALPTHNSWGWPDPHERPQPHSGTVIQLP